MDRKKKLKALLFILLIGLLALLAFLLLRVGDTNTYYSYSTYADVEKDKSVQAATVPKFVPRSAVDIQGWYNVEFNEHTLEFKFAPEDTAAMVNDFQETRGEEANAIKQAVARYSWENFNKNASYMVYARENGERVKEYLAVDPSGSRAFYIAAAKP